MEMQIVTYTWYLLPVSTKAKARRRFPVVLDRIHCSFFLSADLFTTR